MGKTTFLRAVRTRATGFQVLSVGGLESESELPGAALHRALHEVPASDRFVSWAGEAATAAAAGDLLGFCSAVHREIVAAAAVKPVLCLVDDAENLDPLSARAVVFTAHRAESASVFVLFARSPGGGGEAHEFPRLELPPLDDRASLRILCDRLPGIPQGLAEELVELGSGNPTALIELAEELTPRQLAGLAAPPRSLPSGSRLRRVLRRRFSRLSDDARCFVLMAVLDDRIDRETLVRAADEGGLALREWDRAVASGLVLLTDDAIRVPSELVRATLFAETSPAQQREVHQLLVRVLDPVLHRFQFAWHRAAISTGQRGPLADDLHDAGVVVGEAGDYSAAHRAYRRAAELTADPEAKALRLIAAARCSWLAGRNGKSQLLVRQARPLTRSAEVRGLADLVQGGIEMRGGVPSLAHQSLMTAAEQLSGTNRGLAVMALSLAGEASYVAGDYPHFYRAAQRADELRAPDNEPSVQLKLDHLRGMAETFQGRHGRALPRLRAVVRLSESAQDPVSGILASQAAFTLGDPVVAHDVATRAVTAAQGDGASVMEPWALVYRSMSELLLDRYLCAEASSLEGVRVARAVGQSNSAVDHLTILALVAALRGDRETALLRLESAAEGVAMRGLGRPGALSSWAFAAVDLAHDRPADALDRFRLMAAGTGQVNLAIRTMAAPHFVEAAIRCGQRERAVRALESFDKWAHATGSLARRALSHRCHALLAERAAEADEHFTEAIRLHRSSDTAWELAKTSLFYGNRLRRGRKPRAAREFLSEAMKIFQRYQAEHWVRKAQAELRAAGEVVHRAPSSTPEGLTPQQAQISRLVAEGATNREIAAQLYISPRTVDHHLRNIFAKLGVRSRVELSRMLG